MITRSLLSLCFVISFATPVASQDMVLPKTAPQEQVSRFSDAVVFSRQKLTINSTRLVELPQTPKPALDENTTEEEAQEPVERVIEYEEQEIAYAFDVMVRPMALVRPGSLQQLGWMKHDEAMMLIFDETDVVSLGDLGITASVDILFVRPNGLIDAIAPNITPEQMSGAIETRKTVVAALLIKAGMAEHLKLKPGNQVNHKHFQPDTRVLR